MSYLYIHVLSLQAFYCESVYFESHYCRNFQIMKSQSDCIIWIYLRAEHFLEKQFSFIMIIIPEIQPIFIIISIFDIGHKVNKDWFCKLPKIVARRCYVKKLHWNICQNLRGNTFIWEAAMGMYLLSATFYLTKANCTTQKTCLRFFWKYITAFTNNQFL